MLAFEVHSWPALTFIGTFENRSEEKRFYSVLPKRLSRFGLELHAAKSQLIATGYVAATRADQQVERLKTLHFLGVTCYWGRTRKGVLAAEVYQQIGAKTG